MTEDPLLPHLLDIVSDPAAQGLILAGGFGLQLKQRELAHRETRTLIAAVPPARATQDLDFFLRLELFVQTERGRAVRALLDRLGCQEHTPQRQFGKTFDGGAIAQNVMVDLLARRPSADEGIRVKPPRVGAGAGIDLHGRETPEAFAIEDRPPLLPIQGESANGAQIAAQVHIPHAFSWLHMKVKAAHDWLRMRRGEIKLKPNSEKHVLDVYILTAMLTEQELDESAEMARAYADNVFAGENQRYVSELYDSADAPGSREIIRQIGDMEYLAFQEGLYTALAITQ